MVQMVLCFILKFLCQRGEVLKQMTGPTPERWNQMRHMLTDWMLHASDVWAKWQTLFGLMGVRPDPVWSLWRSSKRPGDLSLRTSIIRPGERSMRGSAMALPGDRSNRGSAIARPGEPIIRLSSILPGDFSLSRGRLGDLSRRNSVRASRKRWGVPRSPWTRGLAASLLEMCSL